MAILISLLNRYIRRYVINLEIDPIHENMQAENENSEQHTHFRNMVFAYVCV